MEFMQRNDAMLMELLNEKQSIDGFLESVFGFLARRTDFYVEMKKPTDSMGFPPGLNEQIVLQSMRKWKSLIKADKQIPFANEVTVGPSDSDETEVTTTVNESDLEQQYLPSPPLNSPIVSTDRLSFQESDYYNGAKYENYCWSQTITEIEIYVILPDGLNISRNLSIHIDQNSIKICEKTNESNVLLEGTLHRPCKHLSAMWTTSGNRLQISFDKKIESWWNKLLTTEPDVDMKTINCSRPMEDLPEDTQATLAKLQWDSEQKQQGKPTSDEIEQHKILRKAWDVEGSPFKGTPFEPNIVKFNNN